MNNVYFKVLFVDKTKKLVNVAYGPIKFMTQVIEKEDGKLLILKPTSIYIDQPDFFEFLNTVRNAWNHSE